MDERLERNKQNAQAFYNLMFNESHPAEAIERYVGDEYIQHNPMVADGSRLSSTTSREWRRSTPARESK